MYWMKRLPSSSRGWALPAKMNCTGRFVSRVRRTIFSNCWNTSGAGATTVEPDGAASIAGIHERYERELGNDLGRLAPGARADIVVFDLNGEHLGPFFDPLKNLLLAGRGSDCRASYIAGRCVMEDFAVRGVDAVALQAEADRQFGKLMASHRNRAFGNPPLDRIFHPVFPWAGTLQAGEAGAPTATGPGGPPQGVQSD